MSDSESSGKSASAKKPGTTPGIGGDIDVPRDKMGSFFFMDSDEEQRVYGATTKSSMALTNTVIKNAAKQKVCIGITGFCLPIIYFFLLYAPN